MSFTQIFLTAFHVIFQHGEAYMIMLMKLALRNEQNREPFNRTQRERIDWFCTQEKNHANAHHQLWKNEECSHDLEAFSKFCSRFGHRLIRVLPLTLNLSIAAAIEHFTGIFAELVLAKDLFAHSQIDSKTLNVLKWHCREEIEHRDVVFDVMKAFSNSSLILRVAGLVGAVFVLSFLGVIGTFTLLYRQKKIFNFKTVSEACDLFLFKEALVLRTTLPALLFLKPGYHPKHLKLDHLLKPTIRMNEKRRSLFFQVKEMILATLLMSASISLSVLISKMSFTSAAFFAAVAVQTILVMQLVLQFHDCLHSALFNQSKFHMILGRLIGAYCLWPFHYLRESHISHHRNVGLEDRDTEILHFTSEMTERSRFLKILNQLAKTPLAPVLFTPLLQAYHFKRWIREVLQQKNEPIYRKKLRDYFYDCLFMILFWSTVFASSPSVLTFEKILILGYLIPSLCAMAVVYIFAKPLHTQMFSVTPDGFSHEKRVFSTARSFETNAVVRLSICNLNYHIEHHLNPTAHRWQLRQISKETRDRNRKIAESEELPFAFHSSYAEWYSKIQSKASVHNKMRNIEEWKKANPAC